MPSDDLWEAVQAEMQDGLDDPTAVMTKVLVLAETMNPQGTKHLTRLHFDRSGKALKPWEASGLLATSLADILNDE